MRRAGQLALAAAVLAAVWNATAAAGQTGTGIVLGTGAHVLTSRHVTADCEAVSIIREAGRVRAAVAASDPNRDLALLRLESPLPVKGAELRSGEPLQLGEQITIAGYPLPQFLGRHINVGQGIVSSLGNPENRPDWVQISAPVQLGHSGGPLLDHQGRVVGLVTGKLNAMQVLSRIGDLPQNVNFAVTIGGIRTFLASTGADIEAADQPPPPAGRIVGDGVQDFTVFIECAGGGQVATARAVVDHE